MNLSNIEQGELVVADILFAEQVGAKRRLALVISNSDFNKISEDIVVLKVTSSNSKTPFDVQLTNAHTINNALKAESAIMVDFPVVIVKGKILARPDKIKQGKLAEVKSRIKDLYGL
ncbi:MAG: type II toxin-antitoxin system PemK/MazF family toxin [Candidatus Diapherotrites archaeon]|nr:type II toxin-antitoxin system PemK/MazF family toxin [Candidatus Diapherotrites archaeon]